MARTPRSRSAAAALPTTFRAPAGAVSAARSRARAAVDVPSQRTPRPGPERTPASTAGRSSVPGVPAAPGTLGSLLTGGAAHERAGCTACGGSSVTRLALTLPDGEPATFVSCHTCETRGWFSSDGAPLPLDVVLAGRVRA